MIRRPARFQVAALCWRRAQVKGSDGDIEILLITSRETRRWVLPKGWPKRGYDAGGTAAEEAWEEAGVRLGPDRPRSLGRYLYEKRLDGGLPVRTEVEVFAMEVIRMIDDYPEKGQRELHWVTPQEAAGMVHEPGLSDILSHLPHDLLHPDADLVAPPSALPHDARSGAPQRG